MNDHCPLVTWRKRLGLSQERAAKIAGVPRQNWAAWEVRTRAINLQQAWRIAIVLQLDPQERATLVDWGRIPLRQRGKDEVL